MKKLKITTEKISHNDFFSQNSQIESQVLNSDANHDIFAKSPLDLTSESCFGCQIIIAKFLKHQKSARINQTFKSRSRTRVKQPIIRARQCY